MIPVFPERENDSGAAPRSPWCVKLICCGRDDGRFEAATWEEADRFRTAYVSAEGHGRSAIVESAEPAREERKPIAEVHRAHGAAVPSPYKQDCACGWYEFDKAGDAHGTDACFVGGAMLRSRRAEPARCSAEPAPQESTPEPYGRRGMSERCTRCGCHPPLCECVRGAASRSEQSAACLNCAAAEARAEAWRKAASDMLEVEIEARDKERLREHFRKTEALTRDAAASGRALHATAEDLAIIVRGRAQPAAGASEAFSTTPAAEAAQSPQAAPHDCKGICADFHCAVCGQPATQERPCSMWPAMHDDCRSRAAGQSPQVGAPFREQVYRLLVEGYGPGGGYYEPHQRLDAAISLLTCGWGKAQPATGPTVNPAVASADPELAKVTADLARGLLEWCPSCRGRGEIEKGCGFSHGWGDLCRHEPRTRMVACDNEICISARSALSRLAGQSATANENASEATARGLPEEER
jgi:hypothetical protein